MSGEMDNVRVEIEIENPTKPGLRRVVDSVRIDTGALLSWFPGEVLEYVGIERYGQRRFRQADGSVQERWVGAAIVHVAGRRTSDDVVFAEPGDLVLLGAHTLTGLNFLIDPVTRQLVDAGPAPAAVA